ALPRPAHMPRPHPRGLRRARRRTRSRRGKPAERSETGVTELADAGGHQRLVPMEEELVVALRQAVDRSAGREILFKGRHARAEPVAPLEPLASIERKQER